MGVIPNFLSFIKINPMLNFVQSALLNIKLTAGTYEYEWSAKGLSNGVYFYRLVTDNFVEVKKMVLVK